MADHTGQKDRIYYAMGGSPSTVSRQDGYAQKHERKAIVDGAESANQTQCVTVADEERKGVAGCWRGEVVCPPVLSECASRSVKVTLTNQYNPPDVGIAEPRSAIANPTKKMNILARNQPQTMPAGPAILLSTGCDRSSPAWQTHRQG